jgi:hypothetical protein
MQLSEWSFLTPKGAHELQLRELLFGLRFLLECIRVISKKKRFGSEADDVIKALPGGGKALVGVVFHCDDLKVCNLLAGMRRIEGSHSGENIAEAIIPIILAMGVVDRLGFFIGDNASANDTAIRAILDQLRPDIKEPDSRRVRCPQVKTIVDTTVRRC